jgi:ribonuclease HI
VYCDGTRRERSFSLGGYTTVFQAEVYAIKACAAENLDRNYRYRNIFILSDSQAALKALDKHQINSKLVWDCYQTLIELANHNRVQLVWVPGHEGVAGNETADRLAKIGSEQVFIGPEPACGISMGVAIKAIRDWTTMSHEKYWKSLTELRQAKGLIRGPSVNGARELLKLHRNQLRWVVGLLTGHCHLKGHLFKLGLSDSPTCERCREEDETAKHVPCECEALAHWRLRRLGQNFMEPSDYFDAPTYKILRFIRRAGLLRE